MGFAIPVRPGGFDLGAEDGVIFTFHHVDGVVGCSFECLSFWIFPVSFPARQSRPSGFQEAGRIERPRKEAPLEGSSGNGWMPCGDAPLA